MDRCRFSIWNWPIPSCFWNLSKRLILQLPMEINRDVFIEGYPYYYINIVRLIVFNSQARRSIVKSYDFRSIRRLYTKLLCYILCISQKKKKKIYFHSKQYKVNGRKHMSAIWWPWKSVQFEVTFGHCSICSVILKGHPICRSITVLSRFLRPA